MSEEKDIARLLNLVADSMDRENPTRDHYREVIPHTRHLRHAASEITRLRGEVERWQEIAADRQAAHAALVKEAEGLRGALEPFDDALGEDDEFGDDTKLTMAWGRTKYYALTLGDLRRARANLQGELGDIQDGDPNDVRGLLNLQGE